MTVALIDDQVLGAVLRGEPPSPLAGRALATTGCWYVRLCQAVLSATERPGVLSRPFEELPEAHRRQAVDALVELPVQIELVSLRQLGPAIGRLRQRHSLNLLAGEAVAAANHLDADVFLSAPSPMLEQALAVEGRTWARPPVTAVFGPYRGSRRRSTSTATDGLGSLDDRRGPARDRNAPLRTQKDVARKWHGSGTPGLSVGPPVTPHPR